MLPGTHTHTHTHTASHIIIVRLNNCNDMLYIMNSVLFYLGKTEEGEKRRRKKKKKKKKRKEKES